MPVHTAHIFLTGLKSHNTKKKSLVPYKILSAIPKSKHSAEHFVTEITEHSEMLCSVCQRWSQARQKKKHYKLGLLYFTLFVTIFVFDRFV